MFDVRTAWAADKVPLCLLVRDVGRRETVNRAGGLSDETNILTVVFCFAVSLTAACWARDTDGKRLAK